MSTKFTVNAMPVYISTKLSNAIKTEKSRNNLGVVDTPKNNILELNKLVYISKII